MSEINPKNKSTFSTILWWEIRRIPYNLIMIFAGYLSLYIAYATIPALYEIIGLALNVIYTFGWIIELLFINDQNRYALAKYPKNAFLIYVLISIILVFGFSLMIRF